MATRWTGGLVGAFVTALALTWLQGGCATPTTPTARVSVTIDALAAQDAARPRRVFVVPKNPNMSKLDLEFIEFERYGDFILRSRDFTIIQSPEDADLIAFLAYGISDPQKNLASYSVPTWSHVSTATSSHIGDTHVASTTTGTVAGSTTRVVSYETYCDSWPSLLTTDVPFRNEARRGKCSEWWLRVRDEQVTFA